MKTYKPAHLIDADNRFRGTNISELTYVSDADRAFDLKLAFAVRIYMRPRRGAGANG